LIREGQEDKTKEYSSLCYCYSKLDEDDIKKLNDLKQVDILQKTPIRVLHRFFFLRFIYKINFHNKNSKHYLKRRTVMTRARTVSDINAELIDEHHFRLKMTTQAGTFVFLKIFKK
jgi:tRNA U54 and U55 pseudouridine synthase Pus10